MLIAMMTEMKSKGYDAIGVTTCSDGLRAARTHRPDLILMDRMLPDGDSIDLLRKLRAGEDTPIIVVTARDRLQDRIDGAMLGSDDYIVKPFLFDDLHARVSRLLRRYGRDQLARQIYDDGLLRVDSQRKEVHVGATLLALTVKEFGVLEQLVRQSGAVQSTRAILANVWNDRTGAERGRVTIVVSRLRRKLDMTELGGEVIVSARNIGYLYQAPSGLRPRPVHASASQSGYGHANRILDGRDLPQQP